MKKKLLITASTFPRWKDDTEPRFILDFAKALLPYYNVTVMAPAAPGCVLSEIMEGVQVIRYHYFPIRCFENVCYPGAILSRIRENKIRLLLIPFLFISQYINLRRLSSEFDLIHAHWMIPQGIVCSFISKPYILTGHGGDVTTLNHGIIRRLKLRSLRKAEYITVVSNLLEGMIQKLFPNTKTSVLSMGYDSKSFGRQYRVEQYFCQGKKKIVLFVGRLVEVKGVTYLIEAMQFVDAKLVIVGSGPLEEELKNQAQRLKLDISFLGAKTHAELKSIYASADIFAAPSVKAQDGAREGFGLVLLEAMASGLPVVTTRSGGGVEIIKDSINGLLSDEKVVWQLADNINTLLDDTNLYEKLSGNAVLTANQYDYSLIAEKYKVLYDTILY